uniref:Uncharacterized protein n=1 Tax=Ananas comosus var. bracteatus TaxID=296719 RepID=A0A6V7PJ39_ANACO|nr:unnamed protein product [Ananas comosus var. bracteatus]
MATSSTSLLPLLRPYPLPSAAPPCAASPRLLPLRRPSAAAGRRSASSSSPSRRRSSSRSPHSGERRGRAPLRVPEEAGEDRGGGGGGGEGRGEGGGGGIAAAEKGSWRRRRGLWRRRSGSWWRSRASSYGPWCNFARSKLGPHARILKAQNEQQSPSTPLANVIRIMASLLVSPPLPPPRTVSSPVISSLAPLFRRNPHHVPSLFVPSTPSPIRGAPRLEPSSSPSPSPSPIPQNHSATSPSVPSSKSSPIPCAFPRISSLLSRRSTSRSQRRGIRSVERARAGGGQYHTRVRVSRVLSNACGKEVGELLLNLSRAWELADTRTSNSIATQLPSIESYLMGNVKSALGKRLVSAGRRFEAMGQYGQGELQRIAKTMVKTGKILSRAPGAITDEEPKKESKTLKFGEIEFELTPAKANIGAAVGFVFG